LLYVEPVYVRATAGESYPLLRKVLASFGQKVVFEDNVEDAITAAEFVECDKILGVHYDTFGYIEINHDEAIKKFFNKGRDLMLLEIGDFIEL
jgi:L-ascorbate metabolism protein UlaG (beta-lactamase superfamily)